ncbi:MAG: SpoIIE family protein phosphatase [Betaproteobacteria bacterium]
MNSGHPAVAHLRHELRTPLNHIIGYGEMLLEDAEGGSRARLAPPLRIILDHAQRALARINDILAPAGVAGGVPDMDRLQLALAAPVDEIIAAAGKLGALVTEDGCEDILPDVERINGAATHLRNMVMQGTTMLSAPRAASVSGKGAAALRIVRGAATGQGAILVVDDNDNNREMLSRRLAREGHANVVAVADGREALKLLAAQSFDLVLLDVMMPGIDGYQVLATLKGHARHRDIPVIMISAVDELESAIRCIELGAEDYLPKPFNPTLLRARVGASLEKKRLRDAVMRHVERMEHELDTARAIQLSMVPTDFPVWTAERPLEVYATLRPAYEVGGDLYDFFWVTPQRMCLIVADVSNKGAPAALFMARAKAVLRLLATELAPAASDDIFAAELVARANEELCKDNPHAMFATLVVCVVDALTGEVRWCTAGHDPPYLVAAAGTVTRLAGGCNMPAGIDPAFDREVQQAQMTQGGTLFAFTDGITEAMNERKEMFGSSRLEATLVAHAGRTPKDVVSGVIREVSAFAGGIDPSDDITMLACRWGT